MNLNDELAQWGEPPVQAVEQQLVDVLEVALAAQARGQVVDLAQILAAQPELQQSSQEVLEAVAALHQLAASVLEHSGLLQVLGETTPPAPLPLPETEPAPPLPDPFPREYRLLHVLGTGGFGKVWLAEQLNMGRKVALKTLLVKRLSDFEAALQSLRNDARKLAEIEHPNIVRIHDYRSDGGKWWMVMQYVPGGSLADRLKDNQKLPWQLAARYVADVGEALLAVHGRGIFHRDIKPANILWDQGRDEALLTDFGLATRLSADPRAAGTPFFMAPEAFAGHISAASDVYSLAATLFTLIDGAPPFCGDTREEIQRLCLRGLATPDLRFAAMPDRLEELIRAGLAVDVQRRPTLAHFVGTLRGALNQLLADALASQHVAGQAAVELRLLVTRQRADRQMGDALAATHPPLHGITRDLCRVPPPPERVVVKTGERVSIEVTSSRAGFLSVFNVGPSGNLNLLYPATTRPGALAPQIPANQPIHILDVELKPPTGCERLFAVWSSRPLPAVPKELARVTGHASREYRATRDMAGLHEQVEQLRPEEWHAVVLELDHQPA